jgi:hypothetical protein
MTRLTTLLLPLALAVLLVGCGGEDLSSLGTTPEAVGTIPDELAGTPGPWESTEFDPPISLDVPSGWRLTEDFGMITAFRGAGEAQAVTFETLGEGDLEQRVEQMRATQDLQAGEAEEADIGGREGLTFEAEPLYATTVEGSEYYTLGQGPLRVYVIDVDGTLVAVFAESTILRTERREAEEITAAFFSEADQLINSAEFGAPGSGGAADDGTGDDTTTTP